MQFAKETRKRYPEAEIECWRPERALRSEYRWRDETYQIDHRVFPSKYLRYGWELSVPMLRAARERVRMGGWYFFIHGSYNLHAYAFARVLAGTPVILQSHGGLPALTRMRSSQRRWSRPFFLPLALIERQTLPYYQHIFAVNRREKCSIEEVVPEAIVSFSPVSIDFDLFSPGDKQVSRNRLGLADQKQIALYVGRLAPEKGVQYLLEAAAMLAARLSRFELYLVGSGPSEPLLRRQAKALGIQEHVHFVGYLTPASLVDWYRAADVACLPSLFEGFGLIAAEAMACGTVVVVARSAGTEDVVRLFSSGIMVEPRSAIAICGAIEKVLLGQVDATPDIARARSYLDWTAKLEHVDALFQAMAPA